MRNISTNNIAYSMSSRLITTLSSFFFPWSQPYLVFSIQNYQFFQSHCLMVQAFLKAWETACATPKAVLLVPPGRHYLVNATRFKGPCSDKLVIQVSVPCTIQIYVWNLVYLPSSIFKCSIILAIFYVIFVVLNVTKSAWIFFDQE